MSLCLCGKALLRVSVLHSPPLIPEESASGCGNLTTEPKTMEPEEIKRLTRKALCETPGKEAEVSLVVQQDSLWFILLRSGEEEWAVKVKETAQSTDESIQQDLESEIRKLF